jgi:hypothetical protein
MDASSPVAPWPGERGVEEQVAEAELALGVGGDLFGFLSPLLCQLDEKLDLRLVRTFANTVVALVRNRNRSLALLLTELGALLVGPAHAPAGTKRLANLVHSDRWDASLIEDYLLKRAKARVEEDCAASVEGRVLCILDGSVAEAPESVKVEGISPVISAKARRLSRPRPKLGKGYFRGEPGGPIVVPGFNWLGVLLVPWSTADTAVKRVTLGAWHWYAKPRTEDTEKSSTAESASEPDPASIQSDAIPRQKTPEATREVLTKAVARLGKEHLLHVWDRGLSGALWLGYVLDQEWQFVVRWKKGNRLRPLYAPSVGNPTATAYRRDKDGEKAWRLTQGFGTWGAETIANPRNPKQPLTVGFAARQVCLLHRDDPLWLILVRLGKSSKRRRGSGEPWRLLTNVPISSKEQCWRVVSAYVQRWQIEQMLRFGKSELGIESIRVRAWAARKKLLMLAALAYGYLVELLGDSRNQIVRALLRFCHRTGRQAKGVWRSLYRLRAALAFLWNQHTPSFQGFP